MVRIMTATEPKLITITVDGEFSDECVDAVETCATQAIAQRRPTQLFLRDVSTIDESERALLARLVYCSYILTYAGRASTDLLSISPDIAAGRPRLVGLPMCRKIRHLPRQAMSRLGVGPAESTFPLAVNMQI